MLAIFGNQPRFKNDLHVGRPNIGSKTRLFSLIEDCLERKWLTNDGVLVKQFEKMICEMTGARHCIAVCNATIGLELVVRALGGDGEVIVPAFTFVATPNAVGMVNGHATFCDVDESTHNIDVNLIEDHITSDTVGIIGVHAWGRPCDVERLDEIAKRNDLWLVFDAAHAFNCSLNGQKIGTFGAAEVFSFHATKFVSCGEGGAITTNDEGLADKLRLMRNFGFVGLDSISIIGTNAKMPELSAALGITSIEAMEGIIDANRRNHHSYCELTAEIPGLRVVPYTPADTPNYHYVVLEVDDAFGLTRDKLTKVLHAERVRARRYFYPGCHKMTPYLGNGNQHLPVTERLANRLMTLPNGTNVSREDIESICDVLRIAQAASVEINRLL